MQKTVSKKIVQAALLVALEILLSRFCSINTPIVRIGFGFIPVALMGMLFGPLWAGAGAALGDFIGATLFPTGPFFPGFTLTAFLTGCAFGLLYRKTTWPRIFLAVGIVSLLLNLGLDTLWLYMITGQGYLGLLPTRVLKCVLMTPLQVLALRFLSARVHWLAGPWGLPPRPGA